MEGASPAGVAPFWRARAGFTLLEIMVVVVLIGILTAMILPEMRGTYEDALLRSTSRELVSVFNLAYCRAVSVSEVHRVRLDHKTGHYRIERRARTGERSEGAEFVPAREVPGSEGELDTRISFTVRLPAEDSTEAPQEPGPPMASRATPNRELGEVLQFYPDGTADAAEIVLKDRQGFRLGLRLSPITARVQVVELERDSAAAEEEAGVE